MNLCDIGNTSVDMIFNAQRLKLSADTFHPESISEKMFYISVNRLVSERIQNYSNWHDLRSLVEIEKYYPSMGIDRIMACEAVDNGIIVDAGSAITVDIMSDGTYQGGFISLGIHSAREAYAKLSKALDVSFNFEVDLAKMAKNTPDSITIGFLAPLIEKIESFGKPIVLTGGDAAVLSHFFRNVSVDEDLIFKGMEKLIKKGIKC